MVDTRLIDQAAFTYLKSVSMHVSGLSFAQMHDFLKAQIARVFRNFDLNVNMGQLRSIQVFVVGTGAAAGKLYDQLFEYVDQCALCDWRPNATGEFATYSAQARGQSCCRFRFI